MARNYRELRLHLVEANDRLRDVFAEVNLMPKKTDEDLVQIEIAIDAVNQAINYFDRKMGLSVPTD